MTDHLIAEVKQIGNFSDEDMTYFLNSLTNVFIPKGENFLREGQVSRQLAYIKSGLAMHYKIVDGIETPIDFTKEKEWLAYMKSFNSGTAADVAIKALEDCDLMILSKESMKRLFATQPKFMALKSFYIERSFIQNAEHASNLAILNAKERYMEFVKKHPDLIQRLPQYYIAYYLGIKPQSLSRLRKL